MQGRVTNHLMSLRGTYGSPKFAISSFAQYRRARGIGPVLNLIEGQEVHASSLTGSTIVIVNMSATIVLIGGLILRLDLIYTGQLSKSS